jgi:hypothetical protein
MFDFILGLIDRLPTLKANAKSLLAMAFATMALGFGAYPLWLLYRSDKALVDFLLSFPSTRLEVEYTRDQLAQISTILRALQDDLRATRTVFGIVRFQNRVYLRESYNPYLDPLPLGYQTVWMGAPGYVDLLESLKYGECSTTLIPPPDSESYLGPEMALSNAEALIICPSSSNWFIALYAPKSANTEALTIEVQQAIEEIEKVVADPKAKGAGP